MIALDILLQITAAFYIFAGIVLVRAIMMARLIDQATEAIAGASRRPIEQVRMAYGVVLSLLTYLSGLAVISLCDLALHVLLTTLLLQAAYLCWIAPRYLDTPGMAQSPGRRQSVNAMLVFAGATAIVAWGGSQGRLQPIVDAPFESLLMLAALVTAYLGYVGWLSARTRIDKPGV